MEGLPVAAASMLPLALERIGLFALIALAALRPLIQETYDSGRDPFSQALPGLIDPTPVRTLAIDLLILGCAGCWLLGRALGPAFRYRATGLEGGLILIAAASVISCLGAGNKRVAIMASLDWVCLPIAAIVLVQLVRHRWQAQLLLAAIVASGAVQAVNCLEDYLRFEETWAHYQSIKDEFWEAQGVTLDSGHVSLFEQRIKASEAGGFFAHSNVAGSHLVMCGFAAGGVLLGYLCCRGKRWEGRSVIGAIGAAMLVVTIATTTGLTHSKGAAVSAGAGLILGTMLWLGRPVIARFRLGAWAAAWVIVALVGAATWWYGAAKDQLPGASLTFRWEYWKASADLIGDHFWSGVGRENFGRHYLRYKSIKAPEEIANPHNVFVHAAAEWGILGLAGMAALLIGGSAGICGVLPSGGRRENDRNTGALLEAPPVESTRGRVRDPFAPSGTTLSAWLWAIGVLVCVTAGRIPLLESDDPNVVFYSTAVAAMVWAAAAVVVLGCRAFQDCAAALAVSAGVGLFTFTLHELISFAFFVPAAGHTFFAMAAFVLALRYAERAEPVVVPAGWRWGAFGAACAVIGWAGLFVLRPVAVSSNALAAGRAAYDRGDLTGALPFLEKAAGADPLDPTPHLERARVYAGMARLPEFREAALTQAVAAVEQASARDPFQVSIQRMGRELALAHANASGARDDFVRAVQSGQAVLAIYPRSPADIAELARVELTAAGRLGREGAGFAKAAIIHYNDALELDANRPAWERHRRFADDELLAIREEIVQAQEIAGRP